MSKLIKRKEVLVGKGTAPRLFDRVTIAEEYGQVYISPVDEGRIGTIVEIFKGGMEVMVEWDPLPETPPETPRTPPPFKEEETQTDKSALKDIADKKAAEAAAAAAKKAEQEGRAQEGDEDNQNKFEESAVDEIVLLEFPAATPGALPTGLGNKGRVGEGKAVYSLALHSKAVSMTSIPVYNAAAATELSPSGEGGWFPIARINAHDEPGRGSPKQSRHGSKAPSVSNSKAPSRAQSPLEGTRKQSADEGTRARSPEGREKSPPRSPGSEASSALQPHDHQDLAYSGQVRVQCTWVSFPEIWEWKACGADVRHRDEVSGLAFAWRGWGPGSGILERDTPELSLTSCSLDGQIKSWRWLWSSTLAQDAEGNVLCSIYDIELIAKEREKERSKKSGGSSSVSSRTTSRPGTSGSSGLSRKSSMPLSRKPSMARAPSSVQRQPSHVSSKTSGSDVSSKAKVREKGKDDGAGNSDRTRPRSREADGGEGARPRSREASEGGTEVLSKAELREIEAREKRLREWEQEWTDRRNLAHSGLHIQESDLEMYSATRRIVRMSSYEEKEDQEEDQDGKPVMMSGLNWRRVDGIPTQGRELSNVKLEVALMSRREFKKMEWDSFGIMDLQQGDYIRSGASYYEPGVEETDEKIESKGREDDLLIASDISMLHGIAFVFYAHQTIWHLNAQQPESGGSKRWPHLLFVIGSDGNVHTACIEDVPSNKLKHVGEQEGISPYAAGDDNTEDQEGQEERPESPPLWTREWVFMSKLSAAGGLDNDREMGHPRMQVCPVDSSTIAICSGLALEIWVNEGQSVDAKQSQSLFLGGDSSSEEEEMDYSGTSPLAVKAALKAHQASGKQTFSHWILRAELHEHRDLVRWKSELGRGRLIRQTRREAHCGRQATFSLLHK